MSGIEPLTLGQDGIQTSSHSASQVGGKVRRGSNLGRANERKETAHSKTAPDHLPPARRLHKQANRRTHGHFRGRSKEAPREPQTAIWREHAFRTHEERDRVGGRSTRPASTAWRIGDERLAIASILDISDRSNWRSHQPCEAAAGPSTLRQRAPCGWQGEELSGRGSTRTLGSSDGLSADHNAESPFKAL